ncbi:hypothetical protein Taro_053944, partial [Colocasia esculenta]|nr:hypothetical protein [Colocasia esculenta]
MRNLKQSPSQTSIGSNICRNSWDSDLRETRLEEDQLLQRFQWFLRLYHLLRYPNLQFMRTSLLLLRISLQLEMTANYLRMHLSLLHFKPLHLFIIQWIFHKLKLQLKPLLPLVDLLFHKSSSAIVGLDLFNPPLLDLVHHIFDPSGLGGEDVVIISDPSEGGSTEEQVRVLEPLDRAGGREETVVVEALTVVAVGEEATTAQGSATDATPATTTTGVITKGAVELSLSTSATVEGQSQTCVPGFRLGCRRVPQGWLALGTFWWGMRHVTWLRSVTEGDTFVAVSWQWCQEGCSRSEVVSVARDPRPRELVEGVLRAMSVLKLAADLADSRAEGKMSPWWHWRVWLPDLVVCSRCAKGCFRFMSDSVGFSGTRVRVTTLVGGRGVALFYSAALLTPYFLQLGARRRGSSVSDRFAGAAVAPCVVSSSGDANFGAPGGDPGGQVITVVSECGSTEICVRLPCKFRMRAAVGCSCYCVACVASVVAQCVRAVVPRSALDSLAMVFPIWRMITGKSRRALRHLLVVVVGLALAGCELWCIAWLPCVLGLRCAVGFGLAGAFWRVFPEQCLGGSGRVKVLPRIALLLLLAEVLPRSALCSMALGTFGGGVVPLAVRLAAALARCFASFLTPCVLSQMVVWVEAGVACCALFRLAVLCMWLLAVLWLHVHLVSLSDHEEGEEEGRALVPGVVELAWSEEEVANRREGCYWGLLSRCLSSSRWYRDGLGGRDNACVCLGCSVVPVGVSACAPGLACPWDLLVENAAGYLAAFSDRSVLRFWLARACLGWPVALLRVHVVSVAWDPRPREPVEGVLRSMSVLELAADLANSRAEGKMRVKISKNEEEAPRTPSPHEILSSLASSPHPTTFGNELGFPNSNLPFLLFNLSLAWSCLVFCGHRWSGLVRTRASGGFRSVFSWFRSPILGCQSVVAPVYVVLAWLLRDLGGCAKGCFRFMSNSVGFSGSRVCITTFVGGRGIALVPAALAGEGLEHLYETVELSFFGRPKKEKLRPHLFNEVNQQPSIANEGAMTFVNKRRISQSDGSHGKRFVHISFLAITVGPTVLPWSESAPCKSGWLQGELYTSLNSVDSLTNYCKLPNAYFPPGFKAPKYRKDDGTSDPQYHLAGFTMDSHRWLYDRVLLVHLFQQSLEGEALRWFTSLPASDLINFDIVSEHVISHFSYMATQVPTLSDLVVEKMRPDEDFVTFANRWRSMASRADVTIPESQAIIMIVNNTTSQLKSILMLSEFPSFAHLYNRARVVQNQIKDSSLPHFFEGKPKGRKAPAAPTTEGVTINESHYPPLPETLEDVFFALMSCDAIRLPPQRESVNPRVDTSKYCPYHRAPYHDINNCFTFRDWVYDMNDQGRINWEDVKVAIAKSRPLQLILPKSQEDVHVTIRNQIVPPPLWLSQDEEDNGPPPPAGTEYDILQHLDKTPTRVSILELIQRSPSHQSTLLQFLHKIMVNDDLPPGGVTNVILSLTHGPSISFSDKDLAAPECRSLPLCLTINLNGVSVDSTLIDTGASINVCSMKTLKQLGLGEDNLEKICSTIAVHDNSKRVAKGKIALQLEIGPVTMSSEFLVLDVAPAYKAILG